MKTLLDHHKKEEHHISLVWESLLLEEIEALRQHP